MLTPPLPRRQKTSGPDAASGSARLVFLGPVSFRIVGQRPTVPHHPGVDVGAIRQRAGREHAAIAVETRSLALEGLPGDARDDRLRGGLSAQPCPIVAVGAGLV